MGAFRLWVVLLVTALGAVLCLPLLPGAEEVTYYLPLEYGDRRSVFQGNNGDLSHNDQWNRYAWDFSPMPVGTPVVAAAEGTVTFVKEDAEGPTGRIEDNNKVIIRHADGNVSEYLHIKQNGAVVEKGQKVMRGDLIAYSGNTGNSRAPHLHFQLRKGDHVTGASTACKFADVPGSGVPKKDETVTSGNFPIRYQKECDCIERITSLYSLCSSLGCIEIAAGELKTLAKVKIAMPLAVLKEKMKERDECIGAYRKAAENALNELRQAVESADVETAVRLAVFGEKDFAESDKARDFKAAHAALKKEAGYKEEAAALKQEQQYRSRLSKAVKAQLKAEEGKKRSKTPYKSAIELYEQALELAPSDKTRETLRTHIEELRKKQ